MKNVKRVLCFLLCLVMLLPYFASCAGTPELPTEEQTTTGAEDQNDEKRNENNGEDQENNPSTPEETKGLQYTILADGTYEVSVGEAIEEENIVIPATYEGKAVTKIADGGFHGATLSSVTIPDSVIEIGADAFSECRFLAEIVLPNSVTKIGDRAFSVCDSLTTITLPPDIENVAANAFENTTKITSATIPSTVMMLFSNTKLEILIINGGESIGSEEFFICRNLKRLIIGESITQLKEGAFAFGDNLTDLVIAPTVTDIAANAFIECDHVVTATLPTWALDNIQYPNSPLETVVINGGDTIEEGMLGRWDFPNLKSVTLCDTVTSIAANAFYECQKLQTVILGNSVTSIGNFAFANCSQLREITIGKNVISIGMSAFNGCGALLLIRFMGTQAQWDEIEKENSGLSSSVTVEPAIPSEPTPDPDPDPDPEPEPEPEPEPKPVGTEGLQYTLLEDGTYEVSVGTATNETAIVIPATYEGKAVTKIADEGFYFHTTLQSITIPKGITTIGTSAFLCCSKLTEITVPDSVTSMGADVFKNCASLVSITIPFVGASPTPENFLYQYPFGYIFGTGNYTGAVGVSQSYFHTNTGDTYSKTYYLPASLKSVTVTGGTIIKGAFRGCKNLTSITLPNGITSIAEEAFKYCEGLESITIPSSVKTIEKNAFYYCKSLESVTISNGVQKIGANSFDYCSALMSIFIPDSVTSIYSTAFLHCSSLETITVGSENTKYHADGNCLIQSEGKILVLGCKNSTIPTDGSVTSIASNAFHSCVGLKSIVIPDSITRIGSAAFSGCSSLESITIPFVGEYEKTEKDYYQYPFGYIFGTDSYTGGVQTSQSYYGWSTTSDTYTHYYIPESLKTVTVTGGNILYGAFENCTGLTSIILPKDLQKIHKEAFENCGNLTSITIPDSVTAIDSYAFNGCNSLTDIYFTGTEAQWKRLVKNNEVNLPSGASVYYNYDPSNA